MHELSIAQSIVEVVEQRATECQAARVTCVRLQVGEASGIVADSLAFSFEMLASLSPLLEGACLVIDTVPHRARCRRCEREFAVKNLVPCCPICEEWSADILSGTELQIVAMDCEFASEQVPHPTPDADKRRPYYGRGLVARAGWSKKSRPESCAFLCGNCGGK